jgi:hypothetical protein
MTASRDPSVSAFSITPTLSVTNRTLPTSSETSFTNSSGDYQFTNVLPPGSGQEYCVRYNNVSSTSGRLRFWTTRHIISKPTTYEVNIGDFDIADISLMSPSNNSSQNLPVTFQWFPRLGSTTDNYELDLRIKI